jgi:hypothetical protein
MYRPQPLKLETVNPKPEGLPYADPLSNASKPLKIQYKRPLDIVKPLDDVADRLRQWENNSPLRPMIQGAAPLEKGITAPIAIAERSLDLHEDLSTPDPLEEGIITAIPVPDEFVLPTDSLTPPSYEFIEGDPPFYSGQIEGVMYRVRLTEDSRPGYVSTYLSKSMEGPISVTGPTYDGEANFGKKWFKWSAKGGRYQDNYSVRSYGYRFPHWIVYREVGEPDTGRNPRGKISIEPRVNPARSSTKEIPYFSPSQTPPALRVVSD